MCTHFVQNIAALFSLSLKLQLLAIISSQEVAFFTIWAPKWGIESEQRSDLTFWRRKDLIYGIILVFSSSLMFIGVKIAPLSYSLLILFMVFTVQGSGWTCWAVQVWSMQHQVMIFRLQLFIDKGPSKLWAAASFCWCADRIMVLFCLHIAQ